MNKIRVNIQTTLYLLEQVTPTSEEDEINIGKCKILLGELFELKELDVLYPHYDPAKMFRNPDNPLVQK